MIEFSIYRSCFIIVNHIYYCFAMYSPISDLVGLDSQVQPVFITFEWVQNQYEQSIAYFDRWPIFSMSFDVHFYLIKTSSQRNLTN